jgi:aspartyl protease family protein
VTRLLIIVAVILGALLLLKMALGSGGVGSIDTEQSMSFVYYAMLLALVSGGVIASLRNWGEAARNFILWTVIVLGLVAGYLYRYDAQDFASRMSAGLIPGRAATITDENGFNTVILYRGDNGHFHADTVIDGVGVSMMVDTGASSIALTFEDAERIGLNPATLDFDATVMTANGPAKTAYVTLSTVSIGGIERTNVRAGIAERGRLDQSLLGMSFLETLSSFAFTGEQLKLKD